jgi:hypothetical protein
VNIEKFITEYENYLIDSFHDIWQQIEVEPDKLGAYSVIGGLLSRQVTLSIELARSPNSWNGHSAPLFLRAMTDLYITLSWISLDLEERAKLYVAHGLGEEKLLIELYKLGIEEETDEQTKEQMQQIVDIKSSWINSQKMDWAVEVNLGSWSPLDYRKMSQEADCEGLYKFAYKPFSQNSHNMWPHVSVYNSKICTNPLHRNHIIPELIEAPFDPDFMYRSCKYVNKTFSLFVSTFSIKLPKMPFEWWDEYWQENTEIEEQDDLAKDNI